ncbi:ATP synthase O subunit mitochondrial precursor [Emiliania huxleyi CCMP1516]|uniref:Uncharacterized protein n=2 Tax=Emiliania huxleyi TaxID=2903 RepID=A0A0D3K7D2_EMIH1|nr:ATP synthase O subunit mitochondrial precursor [Emiliania huxleyi CCMP1516]EOD31667.1 ATP synthase O subunit mitochondrial precursor [Emiliania huxleyi CCMP1516]|eukprot:XP_005784096.1 ATP synthase O subunit mitochondrial precursor [Emiliania huxleyi CCMP1516]
MLARGLGRTRRAGTRALSSLPETPPLPLFGIGGRYATAIYTAAAKKGELEKVDTDLKAFSEALEGMPALTAFIGNPNVPRAEKAATLVACLDKMGGCTTSKNAVAVVADGGRSTDLKKVLSMFNELMVAAKGEVTAHVTTAQELDAAGQAVSYSVDPGLISGHTIEMGDKFIDYSAATQLKKLTALLGIGV